jgi:hypothetical protein
VPVEADARTVVAHGGAWVGVAGGLLHVSQRDAGVERGGDEGVAQCVRADPLAYPRAPGNPANDPSGCVPIEPAAVRGVEDWAFAAFTNGEIDGAVRYVVRAG